jgi:putative Mg2+ transporter-C (MgtC) family protein
MRIPIESASRQRCSFSMQSKTVNLKPEANRMDWQLELIMAVRAVLAAILGGIIGFERELHKHDAGIRTYAAVAVGSCVFGLVSMHSQGATGGDSRISAQIVSGIGFICAGVIMRGQGGRTIGLTTAATIWATASIGLTMAYGMYVLGVLTTIITFFLLAVHDTPYWKKMSKKDHLHKPGSSHHHAHNQDDD